MEPTAQRGQSFQSHSTPDLSCPNSFDLTDTPDDSLSRSTTQSPSPERSPSDRPAPSEEDDADFQSHYSLNDSTSSCSSSESEEELPANVPAAMAGSAHAQPRLPRSQSAHLMSNAFAPPFYNRPPTPLPPSPSLTSLLRPTFSAATSRPTTPDSSENDTPNDTEAAVAKSARTATTVPRVSPKVPTYEYYGFVLYLMSSLSFRTHSLDRPPSPFWWLSGEAGLTRLFE
jgi:phosphatidylinositol N-acetylglucosaminyltransferase subunit P